MDVLLCPDTGVVVGVWDGADRGSDLTTLAAVMWEHICPARAGKLSRGGCGWCWGGADFRSGLTGLARCSYVGRLA